MTHYRMDIRPLREVRLVSLFFGAFSVRKERV